MEGARRGGPAFQPPTGARPQARVEAVSAVEAPAPPPPPPVLPPPPGKASPAAITDPVLIKNGVKADYWKTGHSYMKRRTHEKGALAGFEYLGEVETTLERTKAKVADLSKDKRDLEAKLDEVSYLCPLIPLLPSFSFPSSPPFFLSF